MPQTIPLDIRHAERRALLGGEPLVYHCNHFNLVLQKAIREATYIDSMPYLVGAAAEVADRQLRNLFQELDLTSAAERAELATEIFCWAGFGTVDASELTPDGGSVIAPNSHYAKAWRAKFGPAKEPTCFFPTGWTAGAASAIFDVPRTTFSVFEIECASWQSEELPCRIEVNAAGANFSLFDELREYSPTEPDLAPVLESNIDYQGIYQAVSGLDLSGNEHGDIPRFGVNLTRHYANYYNRIIFETERMLSDLFGEAGPGITRPIFVEAGHTCAFYTLGGIMQSPEWEALIRPTCKNDEDWVHGIVAVINTLGWGHWQIDSLSDTAATFSIFNDYESVGYLSMYGQSDRHISYLAEGCAAGIMNLIYCGEIQSRPELNDEFYAHVFFREGVFEARTVKSLSMGADRTTIQVTKA